MNTNFDRSAFARRVALLALPVLLPVTASAQSPREGGDVGTVYGAAVRLGEGTARTYIVMEGGRPTEVGVAMSERALAGLPEDHAPGGIPMPDGHHAFDFPLPMPSHNPTPYRFVALGWNPAGHEPPGIYDLPHFDFHFFTISLAERDAIVPTDPEYAAKAGRFPGAGHIPTGYRAASALMGVEPGAAAVPLMGMHWMDPTTPELNGKTFTETFIFGSWDGRVIFAEPMITKAFLESKPDFREPVARAKSNAHRGADPSEYRIYWNARTGEYRVALTGFGGQG